MYIAWMSKVKVTSNMNTTVWAITFEPEVVETSGWLQNITFLGPLDLFPWRVVGRPVTRDTKTVYVETESTFRIQLFR